MPNAWSVHSEGEVRIASDSARQRGDHAPFAAISGRGVCRTVDHAVLVFALEGRPQLGSTPITSPSSWRLRFETLVGSPFIAGCYAPPYSPVGSIWDVAKCSIAVGS